MNTNELQAKTLADLLSDRNYTIRQAARAIHKSPTQVYYVVRGQRTSRVIISRLHALPKRPRFAPRERIAR